MKRLVLFCMIFFLVCLWVCGIQAQTDYRPGYIITLSGDTVSGQIDYRGDYTMGHICRFESNDGVKTEYTPNDIQSYRFTGSKYYISKTVEEKKYFLEYLIKGKMDIYFLRNQQGDHYYLEKEGGPLVEIPYKESIKWMEGEDGTEKEYFYKSTIHWGVLSYATQDVPQLKATIDKIKEPTHGNLIKVAKAYHNAVCEEGEQCVIFERPLPLSKIKVEIATGFYNQLRTREKNNLYDNKSGTGMIGANIYLWLPRINENWYFKTGFLYTNCSLKGEKDVSPFIKIPLQGAYVYPKGKFRPTFSGGINLYRGLISVPAYSVGCLATITNKIDLSLNVELETEPLSLSSATQISLFFVPGPKLIGLTTSLGIRYVF